MPTVVVPLATGFEEIEAITVIDVLRRADLHVVVAGLTPGAVRGAHGITVETDIELGRVDPSDVDAVVLPGGMPGTTNLAQDARVLDLVKSVEARGCMTAAICAAPLVLRAAGVLAGREVTAHPSVVADLAPARVNVEKSVVKSGPLLTSRGAGTAMEFALVLVNELVGSERAAQLADAMVAPRAVNA